jgi:hypothetical protein
MSQGRDRDALHVLAQTYSNGNTDDAIVQKELRQITDALEFERSHETPSFAKKVLSSKSTRKRVYLACSVAAFCMLSGNNVSMNLSGRTH